MLDAECVLGLARGHWEVTALLRMNLKVTRMVLENMEEFMVLYMNHLFLFYGIFHDLIFFLPHIKSYPFVPPTQDKMLRVFDPRAQLTPVYVSPQ